MFNSIGGVEPCALQIRTDVSKVLRRCKTSLFTNRRGVTSQQHCLEYLQHLSVFLTSIQKINKNCSAPFVRCGCLVSCVSVLLFRCDQGQLTFRSLTTYIYIYICRTAALTSRSYILNIYSRNIHTEYFKHAT